MRLQPVGGRMPVANPYRSGILIAAGICLALLFNTASAQSKLYKHVDANGAVTYTDKPEKDEKPLAIANTARNGNGSHAIHASAKPPDDATNGTKAKAAGGAAGGRRHAKAKGGTPQDQ